jgi:hypothetical protein
MKDKLQESDDLLHGALILLHEKGAVEKLTDAQLSDAVLKEVWSTLNFGSREDWLIDELISRFESKVGIERDMNGEILAK